MPLHDGEKNGAVSHEYELFQHVGRLGTSAGVANVCKASILERRLT